MEISNFLEQAIQGWISNLQNVKKFSSNTIKAYINDLYFFLNFIANHKTEVLSEKLLCALDIKDFRSWLVALNDNKASSNARAVSALKNFFKFLKRTYNISNSTLWELKIRNPQNNLPKAMSVTQAFDLIEAFEDGTWIGLRNKAILMLLYGAGLRISEALQLRYDQLPKDITTSIIIKGKGNKEKAIHLLPKITLALTKYIEACPYQLEGGLLFVSQRGKLLQASNFRAELKHAVKALNLPEYISPHSFRHSFATHLFALGGEIRVIQELLHHKSINTTQRYTKVSTSHLINDYLNAHPRAKSSQN